MHKMLSKLFLGALVALAAMASAAAAQYQAIPNFTGIGAGFNFRQAINQRFSGAQAIAPQIVGLTFANLPAEQNGLLLWCKDCRAADPCSAGGAGAWAMGSRGTWACAPGALEQDLNANGHNIVGAASVKTEQPGDAQYREAIVPGNGIKVGNGETTPFTVVDEGANISGHVNGVINVKAPPYLAKGDGTTDDTAAIQGAVNAVCAASGSNKPEVYLPATPGASYKITSPLLINCALKFTGAGWEQTQITQNYLGPTIIAQAAETGWKPPLTSSVAATWQASHAYAQWRDILDSNGNIEVETASACTSGGTAPTWPTTQPNTVADGTCTWALGTTGGSTQIATGSGSSLDAADSEFFNGANYGSNNATTEIMNPTGLENYITNLGAFTVEFYVEPFFDDGGSFANRILFDIAPGYPEGSNPIALRFIINGSGCTGGSNCLHAEADINGSVVSVGGTGANDRLTVNTIHHVALTYDGSTLRLFIDGQLATGAGVSTSGNWKIPAYESMEIASQGPNTYPGNNPLNTVLPAFYDSFRISKIARYTSTFTPPTAKFTSDSNTVFLLNFPTTAPTGTIEAEVNNGTNAFMPVETTVGNAELDPVYIGNLSLADNGIWAAWMLNSTIENIMDGPYAGRTCINLHDNDYQDTIRRVKCQVVPKDQTFVGFLFMSQSNNNLYDHLQCDGQYTCIEEAGGSGTYVLPDFTDRGYAVYPFVFIKAQALLNSPTTDIEGADSNFLGDIYSYDGYAPVEIHGGQLTSANSGPLLVQNGGAPFVAQAVAFGGTTPAEVVDVVSNPSSPITIADSIIPSGTPTANSGKSWWVKEILGGQDSGVNFADLPSTVVNGTRRYCVDCDPPANPPAACTSAGAKTGAWIDGLNNSWVCVP